MRSRVPVMLLVFLLGACRSPASRAVAEGDELFTAGSFEEAATTFDRVCRLEPWGTTCERANARAVRARIAGADRAVTEGRYIAAERLLRTAFMTADEQAALSVEQKLSASSLRAGIRYERALLGPPGDGMGHVMEEVSGTDTEAGARARAWLAKERPGAVIRAVRQACGAAPNPVAPLERRGSCSEAARALEGLEGAEASAGRALVEAESRRLLPLLRKADELNAQFAARGRRHRGFAQCVEQKAHDPHTALQDEEFSRDECAEAHYDGDTFVAERSQEVAFRRLLRAIGDPVLVRRLVEVRELALSEGRKSPLPSSWPTPP